MTRELTAAADRQQQKEDEERELLMSGGTLPDADSTPHGSPRKSPTKRGPPGAAGFGTMFAGGVPMKQTPEQANKEAKRKAKFERFEESKRMFTLRKRQKQQPIIDKAQELVGETIEVMNEGNGEWDACVVISMIVEWIEGGVKARCIHKLQFMNRKTNRKLGRPRKLDLDGRRYFIVKPDDDLDKDPEAKAKAEENERKRQAVLAERQAAITTRERKIADRIQLRREAEAALERTIDEAVQETTIKAQKAVKKVRSSR